MDFSIYYPLMELELHSTDVTDDVLQHIGKLEQLEMIDVIKAPLSDMAMDLIISHFTMQQMGQNQPAT